MRINKIGFFCLDIGPSTSLRILESELGKGNYCILSGTFLGKPGQEKTIETCFKMMIDSVPDILITGMSTKKDELLLSKELRKRRTKIVWFADTFTIFMRSYVKKSNFRPDLIFVPDETEKKKAENFGYPKVISSGVPLWENFADLSNFPSRKKTRASLEIEEEAKLILFMGNKLPENAQSLKEIVEALNQVSNQKRKVIFLPKFHQADPDLNSYSKILEKLKMPLRESPLPADDLIPACDMVLSACSTVGMAGIYQRKPVINYTPKFIQEMFARIDIIFNWPPNKNGAACEVSEKSKLAGVIETHLESPNILEKAQKKHYPTQKGKKNIAIKEMIVAIKDL